MNSSTNYDQNTYTVFNPKGFAAKAALRNRREIFNRLTQLVDLSSLENVLDVGATADKANEASNFFEYMFPCKEKITALSDQDAAWMEIEYPGLEFVQANALDLPFPDDSFDLVFSSAVIEHVGSYENQHRFISECMRVARKYIFITTPNRWHFIECHTVLPLIHWLPKSWHRKLLTLLNRKELALEQNLNLMSEFELQSICTNLEIHKSSIYHVPFLLLPFNLLLFCKK